MKEQQKNGLQKRLQGLFCVLIMCALSSCYVLKPQTEPPPGPIPLNEIPDFIDYVQRYYWSCLAPKHPCVEAVSFPFYFEAESLDREAYIQAFLKQQRQVQRPHHLEMRYHFLDVSVLNVFWPEIWDQLGAREMFQQEGEQLKVLVVTMAFESRRETAWLLMRREEQQWKVAGYIGESL